MKKIIVTAIIGLFFSMFAISANAGAKSITFVHHYPPGGGSDQFTNVLISELKKLGFDAKSVYFKKNCEAGLQSVNKNKNHILVAGNDDYSFSDTSRCLFKNYKTVKPVNTMYSTHQYLCTTPKSSNISLDQILRKKGTEKPLTISTLQGLSSHVLENWVNSNNLNLKLVRFTGGTPQYTATLAGDVDLYYGSQYEKMVKEGAKCYLSSEKDNAFKLGWMNISNSTEYKQYSWEATLFAKKIDKDVLTALINVLNDQKNETAEFRASKGYTYKGASSINDVSSFSKSYESRRVNFENWKKQ